ncbi:hypothetical protein OS493_019315 [Desmophyllum pertusum]|uniref:Uncharacterized protein n=1 Tax=Desmophyllum pertusum TaxID=174260 RepID=A0A9X0DAR5_9CNID|nr:hypothetical protein OS493_019315 [Desmophyllum pertusum]
MATFSLAFCTRWFGAMKLQLTAPIRPTSKIVCQRIRQIIMSTSSVHNSDILNCQMHGSTLYAS